MKFMSLGNQKDVVSFEQALSRGIPPDGSLYYPVKIPRLSTEQVGAMPQLEKNEIDAVMLGAWLSDEIPADDLRNIVDAAASFETPAVSVSDKHVLELFHGPTMAFKDVAARYLAALMGYFNAKTGRTSTVLVATSGDTGGAIAHGFGGVEGTRVVVLYPKGRVSQLQQEQLRRAANNVHTLEVEGDFDTCQSLVKQALADKQLVEKVGLTSANSITVGRLLPQTLYYARVYAQLGGRRDLRFVVPSGNLGNVTGGVLAQQMGIPIASFLAANNANNAIDRYAQTGNFTPFEAVPTMSNAMDIGAPNNLPRLRQIFGQDVNAFRADILTAQVSDEQTVETIKKVYEKTGYLLDPHTAVAWYASEQHPNKDLHDVIVSTAAPEKFAEEIMRETGIFVDNTAELEKLRTVPERFTSIPNSLEALKQEILNS
ncbi:threonine synthase [Candidatus Saccharibacteria bacterium]|nr:MAG: threonine synthase [Candidatus Saccharibacteria bacterium]